MRKNIVIDKNWSVENIKYGKYKANVPGDITNDLYLAGRIDDPLFGVNFKASRWVLEAPWDYSVSFDIEKSNLDFPHAELVFNGIDTFSEVFLNGEKLGGTDSMYIPFMFNVKGKLKIGENFLTVKMKSPYEIYNSRPNEKYMSIFHPNRIFFRKPACHFMWDWAPDFPGYGIYRPVEISFFDDDEIIETEITTDISGNANFITKLNDKFKYKPEGYFLKLSVTKNPDGDFSDAYEVKLKCEGQFVLQNVCVKKAKLWYPNGYGEQNLYSYKLELFLGDKIVDEKSGRFAFREVKIVERPLDEKSLSFIINVNGTDIFCKGSNWVPASNMTGTIKDETYKHLLSAAKEANYNILRVWGGGLYENDVFYELCDEKGIMVWQDFMFACSDLPDDLSNFRKTAYKEAEYQLKRLRNHPSVVLWCGGNERRKFLDCKGPQYGEYVWEVMLRGLHDKLTRQSVYVPNSPHSRTDIDMDYSSGDLHTSCYDPALIDDRICDYREYLATNVSPFTTECAILGPCRIRSLKKFIPEDKLWGVNEVWHEHFIWFTDYVSPSSKNKTCERYSEIIEKHLKIKMGEYELDELTPIVLQRYVTVLTRSGNLITGKGLAANSVNGIITVIQSSLKVAYEFGELKLYKADKIKRPKTKEKGVKVPAILCSIATVILIIVSLVGGSAAKSKKMHSSEYVTIAITSKTQEYQENEYSYNDG